MATRQADKTNMHRRKSSKEEDDNIITVVEPPSYTNGAATLSPPPARTRVKSTPSELSHSRTPSTLHAAVPPTPPSAGPFRTGFPVNGHPSSPFRSSFSMPTPLSVHSRTRSISSHFSPSLPSPLSSSFPPQRSPTSPKPHSSLMPTSVSAPEQSLPLPSNADPPARHNRRHSRLHSRNLSVFFPRPGNIPQNTISEDGAQEIEFDPSAEAPVTNISSPTLPTPLGAGFTFGSRPSTSGSTPMPTPMSAKSFSSSSSRRGHHHKHSMSHNFFSFLEPGASGAMLEETEELHTQPTPTPISPWTPISPFPASVGPATATFPPKANGVAHPTPPPRVAISEAAAAAGIVEFLVGAWLWVAGQQVGSLACTGLGYWVVFDAFGIGLSGVVPGWLDKESMQNRTRRSYGNARIETVLMFAQAVYLMFSSVYVCKETVEHLLLTAGGAEGHHHHHGDEEGVPGIEFPIFLLSISFLSLIGTALRFQTHLKLVNITGNRLSLGTLTHSLTSPLTLALSNPYTASPLFLCTALLLAAVLIPSSQHRTCDLLLAAFTTVATFNVASRASVVLGSVLLQTSPPRGLPGALTEAFLRAMREVERHVHVLHLPAPHIWQLGPGPGGVLVATLELHVRADLADDDVLRLTRWAGARCVSALGSSAEVTVGVVRG